MSGHNQDVRSLEALHREHAGAVRAYVARRTSVDQVDDVCSEVWLTAWRRRERISADPLPWLLACARRILANERRGARRLAALRQRLDFQRAPATIDIETVADRPLGTALGRLSPTDREVLLLIAWEQLTPQQAAVSLGIKANAFHVRLHRARARLARELETATARHSDLAKVP